MSSKLSFLSSLMAWFSAPQVDELRPFMESRTAFLVQKSIAEYTQARANMLFSTLMSEKSFQMAMEKARWQAFPAGLAMVAEVIFGQLRRDRQHSVEQDLHWVLREASTVVTQFPLLPDFKEDHWQQGLATLEADLARSALADPRPAHAIVAKRASEIFDALPFHSAIRAHDFEMFQNTLAFHLTGIAAELEGKSFKDGP